MDTQGSVDAASVAAKLNVPGQVGECTMGEATDLCTLAKGDARSVVNDVAKQLRVMGYKPNREGCEKPTEKTPENCYVQVVFGDSQALTFLAFPHLLPNPPLRFEGVDTVLAVSKQ